MVKRDKSLNLILAIFKRRTHSTPKIDYPIYRWTSGVLIPMTIPLTVGLAGLFIQDRDKRLAEERQKIQLDAETWRQDADYVKMLGSAISSDRSFAQAIIAALRRDDKFPKNLESVVSALATGRPGDNATQAAASTAPHVQAVATLNRGPVSVFIQYGKPNQICAVQRISATLQKLGYAVPSAELVTNPPDRTNVRFFSPQSKVDADKISSILDKNGFNSSAENFESSVPLRQIELWLGKSEHSGYASTENGLAITTERGEFICDSNAEPFTIGVSPLG